MARDRDEREDRDEEEGDRPRRRREERDEDEVVDERRPPQTRCPGTSKAAGILLVVIGSVAGLVTAFGVVSLLLGGAGGRGPELPTICGLLLWLTITLYGLMAGVRTLTGNSTEPIFNGVIGILFSVLFVGVGAVLAVAGSGAFGAGLGAAIGGVVIVIAALFLIYGLLLLVAGILLLVGRNKYVGWRQYRKEQRRTAREYEDRPRKRRREEEDDEYEDRPRKRRREEDD